MSAANPRKKKVTRRVVVATTVTAVVGAGLLVLGNLPTALEVIWTYAGNR